MITNEKQYRATKHHAAAFREAIAAFDEKAALARGIDPLIVRAQLQALKGQFEELRAELAAYEKLRDGGIAELNAKGIRELPDLLIKARVAKGLSQKELAARLGMREQQVQRYEAERYSGASLRRIEEVAAALSLDIAISVTVATHRKEEQRPAVPELAALHPDARKEIIKRNWLEDFATNDVTDEAFTRFYAAAFHGTPQQALHKRSLETRRSDTGALLAWQARILLRAREAKQPRGDATHWSDASWISSMAELTQRPDGPTRAQDLLKNMGIALFVEPHLSRTYLDGAVMMLDGEMPVIGLTLRLDRLDNFWFVLLHEIGHLLLHRRRVLQSAIFDEDVEAAVPNSALEAEADDFARTALIPDEAWESSMASFVKTDEEVIALAHRFRVGAAVVAGRLRRERNDYRIFTKLVGQGSVKELFEGRQNAAVR